MNARDLKGLAVVTLSDAEKVGHVDDVLFDAQYRQVLGFRVKHGALGGTEAVLRRDVSAIGQDAITIPSRAALNDEKRFPELVGASTLGRVEGTHVVTEGGTRLGSIHAVRLDDEARNVLSYALDRSFLERLRGEQPMLDAQHVQRIGERGIMVVANAALPAEGEQAQPAAGAEAQPARPQLNMANGAGLADDGQALQQDAVAQPPNLAARQPSMDVQQPGAQQSTMGRGTDVARGRTAPVQSQQGSMRRPAQAGPMRQPQQPGTANPLDQPGQFGEEPPAGLMRPGISNPAVSREQRSGMDGQPGQPPVRPPEREQQPPAGV